MFGEKYTLVTAVLMTMASIAWAFNLYISRNDGGVSTLTVIVVLTFAAFAVGYWIAYFRKKNAQTTLKNSGTE